MDPLHHLVAECVVLLTIVPTCVWGDFPHGSLRAPMNGWSLCNDLMYEWYFSCSGCGCRRVEFLDHVVSDSESPLSLRF